MEEESQIVKSTYFAYLKCLNSFSDVYLVLYCIVFVFFSEELLLQEDSSDVNSMTSEFIKGMHLSQPLISSEPLIGAGSSSRISNATVSMQRWALYSQNMSTYQKQSLNVYSFMKSFYPFH